MFHEICIRDGVCRPRGGDFFHGAAGWPDRIRSGTGHGTRAEFWPANSEGNRGDAASAPVVGATVFLKDLKSKSIRSYTTDADGHFRFTQVYMAEDHELWAEKDGKKSATKTISTWDTRQEYISELKLK